MGFLPRGCAARRKEGASNAAPARRTATVRWEEGVWPIGRRAASSAWIPSARRMHTAFQVSSAAVPPGLAAALSSAAASPWGSAARGRPVTRSSSPRPGLVRRDCCATGAAAASRAGWERPRAVLGATRARRAMKARPASPTAVRWAVPVGSSARPSETRSISASGRCMAHVPRRPAPKESSATCGCRAAAASSGARGAAIRGVRTAAPPARSAASAERQPTPATADAIRWTRTPAGRGACAPPPRRT